MPDDPLIEGVKSTFRAVMSRAFAAALITGIDQASDEGHTLTQVQQIDIATMVLMSYHDAIVEAESSLEFERLISKMRGD